MTEHDARKLTVGHRVSLYGRPGTLIELVDNSLKIRWDTQGSLVDKIQIIPYEHVLIHSLWLEHYRPGM